MSCQDTIQEAKKRRKQKRKQEIEGGAGTSKAATNDFFSDPRKYAQGGKLGWFSPGAFTQYKMEQNLSKASRQRRPGSAAPCGAREIAPPAKFKQE